MPRTFAAVLILLSAAPAAAAPAGGGARAAAPHRSGASWQVRVHRGMAAAPGQWHRNGGRRWRSGSDGSVWPSFGYGGGAAGEPRPGGFFADGDTWMRGRQVVYEYDRGYPYDHYRGRPRR